jgi:hypothetical protein
MDTKLNIFAVFLGTMLLAVPDVVKAQFAFTTNNGAITITGYNGSPGIVVIPSATNGYPVTSIGAYAFGYRPTLTSVTIPDSVTNIGNGALYSCSSLTNLTIGTNVIGIGNVAFYGSGLTSITIPDKVTVVGNAALQNCINLTNVIIGMSVTSLGNQPFDHCYKLTAITVNPTNPLYSSTNGVLFNGNRTTLYEYPMGRAGTFTVPNSVMFISAYAFDHCTNLASVTIGNSGTAISSIGECAFLGCCGLTNLMIGTNVIGIGFESFAGCTNLTSVTIPYRVNSIGQDAFAGCSKLTAITVDTNNSWFSSVVGVLFDKSQSTIIQYPGGVGGSYTIPDSVTNFGVDAFGGCTKLTSVTIPDSVTSIGNQAFEGCTGLTNIVIGTNVTSIGAAAFDFCTGLTSVTIPGSVTSIGWEAFYQCSGLTNVTISASVTSIGDEAFYWCTRLIGVYFLGNAPSLGSSPFGNTLNATVHYLPGTTGWETFDANSGANSGVLWVPQAQTGDGGFGVQNNQFGFNITWASGTVVVVEASTSLADPVWTAVGTNTLTGGSSYFNDSQWTNYPGRFYRLRSQ